MSVSQEVLEFVPGASGTGKWGSYTVGIVLAAIRAAGIMLVSLVIAGMMIGYLAFNMPDLLNSALNVAGIAKGWITNTTNTGISAEYNIWLKFLIQDQQLVFMALVILVRLVLALAWSAMLTAFPSKRVG